MVCPIFQDGIYYCLDRACNFFNTATAQCDYDRLVKMREDEKHRAYIEQNRAEHQAVEHG